MMKSLARAIHVTIRRSCSCKQNVSSDDQNADDAMTMDPSFVVPLGKEDAANNLQSPNGDVTKRQDGTLEILPEDEPKQRRLRDAMN